jgi:RNA polymerase sigma-70 factor (ECF subfamily)
MENQLLEKYALSDQQGKDINYSQESDASLIDQAFLGDHAAFEHLVSRHSPTLFAFVRRHTSEGQVEDIVQSVFLQLYLSLPQLYQNLSYTRSATPLRSWLLRVAANRCIDEGRRKHPLHFSDIRSMGFEANDAQEDSSPEENIVDPSPLPEEEAERQDLQSALRTAIAALPVKFRNIVLLRYTEELTFKEISSRLQMPENTVRTYFRRARPLLRASLSTCA